MQYEGDIYRPPSEAHSLIVQATIGCTHNGCTFCPAYKAKSFRLKPFDAVLDDFRQARSYYRQVGRIFIADGDALCMSTAKFLEILGAIREIFPECQRVGTYSRASHILSKSTDDLAALRDAGLGIIYIGAESGSDEVLRRVNKGETSANIIASVRKSESAGIPTSVTFILGLGGKELMTEHAVKTGEMISAMGASYVGLLTLVLTPMTPILADVQSGKFTRLTPLETVEEQEIILENSYCDSETILRSNHASNWLVLKGTLPYDKDRMLRQIRDAKADTSVLRVGGGRSL